jgi:hypothetical protein
MEFVIRAVLPNALINFIEMLDHALDQRLCEFADARRGRAELPKFLDLFRAAASVQIAPEMILDGGLPRDPTFAHKLFCAQLAHHICDRDGGARGFRSAVDRVVETTLPRLLFIFQTEHGVDNWHAVFNRDPL